MSNSEPQPETPPAGEALVPDSEEPLPTGLRIVLYFVGWLLLLVGVAGLMLPVLQGVLFLVLGAAVLSVASEATHRWLRRLLRPWPKGAQHLEKARRRLHRRLSRNRR